MYIYRRLQAHTNLYLNGINLNFTDAQGKAIGIYMHTHTRTHTYTPIYTYIHTHMQRTIFKICYSGPRMPSVCRIAIY